MEVKKVIQIPTLDNLLYRYHKHLNKIDINIIVNRVLIILLLLWLIILTSKVATIQAEQDINNIQQVKEQIL